MNKNDVSITVSMNKDNWKALQAFLTATEVTAGSGPRRGEPSLTALMNRIAKLPLKQQRRLGFATKGLLKSYEEVSDEEKTGD